MKRIRFASFPLLLACLWVPASTPEAKILRVSPHGDGSDPSTWEGAFSSVGAAISAATAGDEIWVASGRYNESVTMKKEVSMFGGFAGFEAEADFDLRDWRANETILDATGLNDRVVVGADGTVLDGFTITRGKRASAGIEDGGSGMLCREVTMTIRNCYFHHNGEPGRLGRPFPAQGGAIFSRDANLHVENCLFLFNIASISGAIAVRTLHAEKSIVILQNCLIDHNSGPAYTSFGGENHLINCTFGNNNGNHPSNSDITGGQSYSLTNCIIRNINFVGDPDYHYSNIPGLAGINNNIDADPLFVDPENGDYRLQLNSPCIDAGTKVNLLTDLDGNPRPIDVVGRGHEGAFSYDMGAYEFQLKKSDLDKNGKVNAKDLLILQQEWMVEN